MFSVDSNVIRKCNILQLLLDNRYLPKCLASVDSIVIITVQRKSVGHKD